MSVKSCYHLKELWNKTETLLDEIFSYCISIYGVEIFQNKYTMSIEIPPPRPSLTKHKWFIPGVCELYNKAEFKISDWILFTMEKENSLPPIKPYGIWLGNLILGEMQLSKGKCLKGDPVAT